MPSVQRSGVRIHYEVTGTGRPVVLGHSFLCSGAMWAPQIEPLGERFQVINVDTRGHGASGPAEGEFTLYDVLDDTVAVLDALGAERAVWAGLSLGGMVALRAALQVPGRVAGLILLDTDGGPERLWNRAEHSALALLARMLGMGLVAPRVARLMFGGTTSRENPALVAEWTRRFASVHIPSALRALSAVSRRDDLLPSLKRVAVPALVLVGLEDRALPPDRSGRIAEALPRARLVGIPRAGHLSTLEQPDVVTRAMLDFLEGVPWSASLAR